MYVNWSPNKSDSVRIIYSNMSRKKREDIIEIINNIKLQISKLYIRFM